MQTYACAARLAAPTPGRVCLLQALAILSAEELIAVNQDPMGVAGDLIWKEGPLEVGAWRPGWQTLAGRAARDLCCSSPGQVLPGRRGDAPATFWLPLPAAPSQAERVQVYAAPLVQGTRAVVLFNRHTPFPYSTNITVQFSWLGYHADSKVGPT